MCVCVRVCECPSVRRLIFPPVSGCDKYTGRQQGHFLLHQMHEGTRVKSFNQGLRAHSSCMKRRSVALALCRRWQMLAPNPTTFMPARLSLHFFSCLVSTFLYQDDAPIYTNACALVHTHVHIHTRMHTYTHVYTHTLIHTYTHTRTHECRPPLSECTTGPM